MIGIHCLKYQRCTTSGCKDIVFTRTNIILFRAPELDNPNYPLKGSKGSVYEGGTKVLTKGKVCFNIAFLV